MIKDSGERREFDTGAVRDIQEGKGRCDLMPLDVVAGVMNDDILLSIERFRCTCDTKYLYNAIRTFSELVFVNDCCTHTSNYIIANTMLEVAKQFEDGAKKYGENNWQKGLPVHCYIDSAVRHYLKWSRGDTDERHDRAFVWNIMCCVWTIDHMPELDDYCTACQLM